MRAIRRAVKRLVEFRGLDETAAVRERLAERSAVHRDRGWPYCPVDMGDLLFRLRGLAPSGDALEVGMATGSTALYLLAGLPSHRLVSIDHAHGDFDREGEWLIREAGLADRHQLIEADSVAVLPQLWREGRRFSLAFLDGWKGFDRLWVDTFYCAQMLTVGGYIVFDDSRMPAVRKGIRLLRRYYEFEPLDSYSLIGGWKQRVWHLLSTRSLHRPYFALRKRAEIDETRAGSEYGFWRPF